MSETLKSKTTKGFIWSAVENFSIQAIQFVFGLIMARILTPHDYGLVGMLVVFIAIGQTFTESGFANALIQNQKRTEVDYSTAFYFNIVVGVLSYLILFVLAPFIASFYGLPQLEILTRVLMFVLIINSFSVVQRAQFTINLDFKKQAQATVKSVFISGVIGIVVAYFGGGVWSLVIQLLSRNFLNVIFLWYYSKWRPVRAFSWESFKGMWSFGYKLLCSGLLDTLYKNIYQLLIGKFFSSSDLGNYTRAQQFAVFPSINLTSIHQRVAYPILSSIQDNSERLSILFLRYLRLAAFVAFPLMIGLSALAEPLILSVLTKKWEGAIVLLQIICFSLMWHPVQTINLNVLKVKARTDLYLKLEIYSKIIGLSLLVLSLPFGLYAMCISGVFSMIFSCLINSYYVGKEIGVGMIKQIKVLLPIFFSSLIMGAVVFKGVSFIDCQLLKLFAGVILGVVVYLLLSYIICKESLDDLLFILKRKVKQS